MKVLLVDDDVDLLDMTARRLKRKGCEVIVAGTLSEAYAKYDEHVQDLRAVVCDLFLGDEGNGVDFFVCFNKRAFPGEFVLATGDDSGDSRIEKYRQTEARFSCLQKPFELDTLMEILQRG